MTARNDLDGSDFTSSSSALLADLGWSGDGGADTRWSYKTSVLLVVASVIYWATAWLSSGLLPLSYWSTRTAPGATRPEQG